MDHLPWCDSSSLEPVKVPFVCGDGPLCGSDDFSDFPQLQGWTLNESASLAQLAERAQAWLFFGLLAVAGIHPHACIGPDTNTVQRLIDTTMLKDLLEATVSKEAILPGLFEALSKAENMIMEELLPLIRDCEALESLHLWNSQPFAVLFSIDILLDSIKFALNDMFRKRTNENVAIFPPNLRLGSFFPRFTSGLASSLLHSGRCRSLVHRLDYKSSEFYHLMSLPTGNGDSAIKEHSECSDTFCSSFDVDQTTYRTRHTDDCVMCDSVGTSESELLALIRKDEVPVIRSTVDSTGAITICLEKMAEGIEYTAISHVWAGGLGNFKENMLPHCQVQTIHHDVCHAMTSAFNGLFGDGWQDQWAYSSILGFRNPRRVERLSWRRTTSTCYYWMDTLCIPNNHPDERKKAINSMARIYAGAASVLVLDPTLSRVQRDQLGSHPLWKARREQLLVQASPWMARSWPLQEAALPPELYVKFADGGARYEPKVVGLAATLEAIPNLDSDRSRLIWDWNFDLNPVGHQALHQVGELLPYKPNDDFVKVWNLLTTRSTMYHKDVPAIFAVLIHKSAAEILSISPVSRTWALLQSADCLPLDILCVEQDSEASQWMPRLPGSNRPVPKLDPSYGTLKRGLAGFTLGPSSGSKPLLALICSNPLGSDSFYLLRNQQYQNFIVHVQAVQDETSRMSGKTRAEQAETGRSHLILLLPKALSGPSSDNYGVLLKIKERAENTLRVQITNKKITWRPASRSDQAQFAPDEIRDYQSANSYSILVEMETGHWPILKWSRFEAYPYRHVRVRTHQFTEIVLPCLISCLFTLLMSIIQLVFIFFNSGFDNHPPPPYLKSLAIANILALPIRLVIIGASANHFRVVDNRRTRFLWSLSFWDVPRAEKTLCKLPYPTPIFFFTTDLAVGVGLFALFLVIPYSTSSFKEHAEYYNFIFFPVQIEYIVRSTVMMMQRAHWFFSTWEFRRSRPWQHIFTRSSGPAIRDTYIFWFRNVWVSIPLFVVWAAVTYLLLLGWTYWVKGLLAGVWGEGTLVSPFRILSFIMILVTLAVCYSILVYGSVLVGILLAGGLQYAWSLSRHARVASWRPGWTRLRGGPDREIQLDFSVCGSIT